MFRNVIKNLKKVLQNETVLLYTRDAEHVFCLGVFTMKTKREIIVKTVDGDQPCWKVIADAIAMELTKGASNNDREVQRTSE